MTLHLLVPSGFLGGLQNFVYDPGTSLSIAETTLHINIYIWQGCTGATFSNAHNAPTLCCLSLQVIPSDHNLHQNDAQLQANGQGEDYQYQGPAGPLEFVIALSIFGRHFPGFSIYSVFSYSCHI